MPAKTKIRRKSDQYFEDPAVSRAITMKVRPDIIHAQDHPSINYFLAVNLTQARKKKGMTQSELAKKAKLSLRTIQGIETLSETNSPTLDTLDAIALALGMKIAELLKTWKETEVFV